MPSFHSIAQNAQNESGHFFHYQLFCQRAIEPKVQAFHAYLPLNAELSELPRGWKKWFHPFYNSRTRSLFWKDCRRLFQQSPKEERIFFLEFFARKDFRLFALAALLHGRRKKDAIWVVYRDDLTVRRKKDLGVIRFFSKCLHWKFGNRFVPLTDSELLADYYQSWFGKKPFVLPIPHTHVCPSESKTKEKLICSWPGPPRPEKGAKEIARLTQIDDPLSVNIELDLSGAALFPSIKNQVELHLRKALLTEKEYFDALFRADVILLPYDPEKYKWRTSGPFVEAVVAGKMPLVKEGTWQAYELKRFDLCELIVNWENPLFFTHLFTLIRNADIKKKLEVMQQAYAKQHSQEGFASAFQSLV